MVYNLENVKSLIYCCFVLFLSTFFISCSNAQECIKLDQSYVEYRDSGYRDLYFCNSKCDFFNEYYNLKDSTNIYNRDSKVNLFLASSKIIDKQYYKEIKGLILEMLKEDVQEDGMIWVTFLDTDENILKEGSIIKKDFQLLKEKISQLNTEYDIDSKNVNLVNWYFETVEKGVVID